MHGRRRFHKMILGRLNKKCMHNSCSVRAGALCTASHFGQKISYLKEKAFRSTPLSLSLSGSKNFNCMHALLWSCQLTTRMRFQFGHNGFGICKFNCVQFCNNRQAFFLCGRAKNSSVLSEKLILFMFNSSVEKLLTRIISPKIYF